jgi:DNA-binding transcriptional MerR regulator/methylmalonyl-CoA mutase cobalamin-binding subunit
MKASIRYPIRYVVRQTGLKPHLIRTWEERYGAVHPERSPSNQRLYSDADIKRLRLLERGVDGGHAISALASLTDEDLQELVERGATMSASDDKRALPPDGLAPAIPQNAAQRVDLALDHVLGLDIRGLEKVLSDAAVEMPRQAFLQEVVLPLFNRVGAMWQSGKLKVVCEHMASATVRPMLWDMLRSVRVAETAPRIIMATPVGHWHEFGALISALTAAESGWQAFYFGPNLPSEEIAFAARKLDAQAIGLSLCHHLDDHSLAIELTRLRRAVGTDMPLIIGGTGAAAAVKKLDDMNVLVVNDLDAFRRQLEALMRT